MQVRQDHPKMSLRSIYYKVMPTGIGRSSFEQLGKLNGLDVEQSRSFIRTTNSKGVIRFPNLIEQIELKRINQVWVSDITYVPVEDEQRYYYLTLIMDAYSNFVLGYSISKTLQTIDTTLIALKRASQYRVDLRPLIFHSDGGGQYYCKEFITYTKELSLVNSMGVTAYENPQAERLNGILKNQYILPKSPRNYEELKRITSKSIWLYNHERPMPSKKYLTAAEIYLNQNVPQNKRLNKLKKTYNCNII
jgi:transposase InsO family protein